MARLLQSYGLMPEAMIGHSLGEYVAACVAGVFSLENGLKLVAARGRLMQGMAAGRMLSVRENEARLRIRVSGSALSLAAVNDKEQCVVSGPIQAIEELRGRLAADGVESRELDTSHAFHSAMMEPMIASWRDELRGVSLCEPTIPYVSNLSGDFIRVEEATDVEYWVKHLRETVRFGDGLDSLMSPNAPLQRERVFVEVGPGHVLSGIAKRRLRGKARTVVPLLGRAGEPTHDTRTLHQGIGQLWMHGVPMDWPSYHAKVRRQRVPLPTYPFERQRFWVETSPHGKRAAAAANVRSANPEDWFYAPLWRLRGTRTRANTTPGSETLTWVAMIDGNGIGEQLVARLRNAGHSAIVVRQGDVFARIDRNEYVLSVDNERHYHELIKAIKRDGARIDNLVHLWALELTPEGGHSGTDPGGFAQFEARQRTGYYSLMFAIKALATQQPGANAVCTAITHDAFRVTGGEELAPEYATVSGLCKVAPQEYSNIRCRHVDFSRGDCKGRESEFIEFAGTRLFNELMADWPDKVVAFRRNERWTQTFERPRAPHASVTGSSIKPGGVYVITGALGKVGYALAEHFASMAAKLVLIVRDELPDRALWDNWIASHGQDDPCVRKLERLLALEAKGAQVLICKADVTDEAQMVAAFDEAEIHFGAIDGVIHCAGQVRDSVTPLTECTVDTCRAQFLPKVKGAMVLERVLEHRRVDFCVLMSSLSAVLGGLGFAAYAAANAYMDAFASRRHAKGDEAWLSINWDGWHVGEPNEAPNPYSMTGPEGAHALEYVLSWSDLPQLVHSTGDLQARMEKWIEKVRPEPANMRLYMRNTEASYIPPASTIEFQLVEIWQQLLGLEKIGIRDRFFELGGDSLLATILIAQINKVFNVNVPIRIVFEEETIERIATQIDALTKRPPQGKPLALRRTGVRKPLFCIHPGSGFGRSYLPLLRHLSPDLPVYALEARGLNEDEVLPATIGDMAADYIGQIQVIQPSGPYHLLGWSFGAIAAHAIAAQMHKRGLPVGKLIMIDATPRYDEPWPAQSVIDHRRELEQRLATYKDYQDAADELKKTMVARMSAIHSNNIRLSYYRDPEPFRGNILIIRSTCTGTSGQYEFFKQYVTGNVTEIEAPHHHNKLLTHEALEYYGPEMRSFLDGD